MDAVCGEIAIDASVAFVTVRVETPLTVPTAAFITVLPRATVVARPVDESVAIPGEEDVQVTTAVMFCLVPVLNVPVAVNCWKPPRVTEGLVGDTAMDRSPVTFPSPLRFTRIGLPKALNAIVRVPVLVPVVVGVNVIAIAHLCPAATLEPQVLVETE